MSNAVAVTDATFEEEVVNSSTPVLVDFWAEWCGPCKTIGAVLDQVANESPKFRIAKIDVDNNPGCVERFEVMSIPTLILFKDGEPVERLVGAMTKEQLLRRLAAHL